MSVVRAWAAAKAGALLKPYTYDPGALGAEQVEIAVAHCGICHSDLSMLDNDWGATLFPFVGGHEIVGTVTALGAHAKGLRIGQRVGVGWNASSCMHCAHCLAGRHHLCSSVQGTIVGRHGGFAERVRAHWAWAVPLPEAMEADSAGPLLCGGITVFSPLLLHDVKPVQRVGVVGIGGLGHLALKFLKAWGCEITAFTSSGSKRADALAFGAHRVVNSRDARAMREVEGQLDMLLVTVNVALDWGALMGTLAPRGRLHFVGAVLEDVPVNPSALITGEQSVSGSPTGSRAALDLMMEFAARHAIRPQVERFPMSRVNDALERLRAGDARYRIVLDADFG